MQNLQRRLAYEAASRDDGRISVLACEHEWAVHPVAGTSGAMLHGPGILTLYVVAPVGRLCWTIGEYLRRLRTGLTTTVEQLGASCCSPQNGFDLFGNSGKLASFGIHVRRGITLQGASLHVCPDLAASGRITGVQSHFPQRIGSLLLERESAGRMEEVRSLLPICLAGSLGCDDLQVLIGHPLLPDTTLERAIQNAA